jgi:proline iminopeptidase
VARRRRILGAALAIAHALDAPDAVSRLLLRAVLLAPTADTDAFFAARGGMPALAWRSFGGADEPTQTAFPLHWWHREQTLAGSPAEAPPQGETLAALIDRYRVQSHSPRHACWLDTLPLLDRVGALPHVPTLLLHGVDDRVCPAEGAMALSARLPHAMLRLVPGACHDPTQPAMAAATVRALTAYAEHAAWLQPPAP